MTDDSTDNGESAVESLAAAVTGDGSNGDGSLGEDVRAIVTIIREAEEILEAIDVSELPDAVDADQVREAIELGEIPDALQGDENAEVVKLRQVIRAIDLGQSLASMDVTDVWESKRSIDDATDELDDDDEGGLFGDEGLLGDDEGLLGGDSDGGLTDDLLDTDLDHAMDTAAEELKEDVDIRSGDMSAYQEVIQQQAMVGVDAFREALLKTHGGFERIVETNREKMRQQDRQPSSRNPTAVSTIASSRSDVSSVPNYATMPRTVRHSNAPTRSHIYGDRFRREREKRGYE